MKQNLKQYVNLLPIRSKGSVKMNSPLKETTNIKYTDKTNTWETCFQLKEQSILHLA